ncbi:hypothetical protein C1Y63_04900 [Corynebacterium sp. 13CS0277]|uniref:hypothetical protein n=1 Tax=Corynebacterium sp. 13CS0277 TaxID=2071994 RepID=UPI000D036DD5|nr:hypothetical protein [Corynebacterium sp. 13CS0277]PRQ11750.1 hypothetical protein C1Y63_04900 [Corynebacterium sp. 13CS0277]
MNTTYLLKRLAEATREIARSSRTIQAGLDNTLERMTNGVSAHTTAGGIDPATLQAHQDAVTEQKMLCITLHAMGIPDDEISATIQHAASTN